jgi:hypothetical protein
MIYGLTDDEIANGWVTAGLWRTAKILDGLADWGIDEDRTVDEMISDLRAWALEVLEEVALHQVISFANCLDTATADVLSYDRHPTG